MAKNRSRKAHSSEDEGSDIAASPETQESFEPANYLSQRIAQSFGFPDSASHSSDSFLRTLQGRTDPPSILISHDADNDMCGHVEMMDTSADFMDDTHSPYLMIGVASSPDVMERPSSVCSSSTYADSPFDSDMDDINTENGFEIDLGECDIAFQPLLGPAVLCLLAAYFSSRQHAPGNSGEQSSNSSYPSSFDGKPGTNGFGSSNFTLPLTGGKRRRNTEGEDDGSDDGKSPKRKNKATRSDEDLPPLACPFLKFDPLKHDKCYTLVLKGISRVK
jgi:hypothetical protein